MAEVDDGILDDIERTAVELARLAGAEIVTALGRVLAVRYKRMAEGDAPTDPVSEVDHQVEVLIRARLAERFPDHGIIGEELDEHPGGGGNDGFIWVVDPIDGTSNFVNGFPVFSASIGVLHAGRPVVGALWCSVTHALRAGIYHAQDGGRLRFEDEPLAVRRSPDVRRRLAGEPNTGGTAGAPWDVRVTGSAAVECALVAAGLLRVARFGGPNIWDVGGGLALVRAAGLEARSRSPGDAGWTPFERFAPMTRAPGETPGLRAWQGSVVIGEPDAVEIMCRANG